MSKIVQFREGDKLKIKRKYIKSAKIYNLKTYRTDRIFSDLGLEFLNYYKDNGLIRLS